MNLWSCARASLALTGAVLFLFPGTSFARQSCTTGSKNDPPEDTQLCSGTDPYQYRWTAKHFTMYGSVSCNQYGYYGASFQNSASAGGLGQCAGAAANNEPICKGVIGSVMEHDTGPFYSWDVAFQNSSWDGQFTCNLSAVQTSQIGIDAEGCNGASCCGGTAATTCEHEGGLFSGCVCGFSPIIISLDDGSVELTSLQHGVMFDMLPDGARELTSWTRPASNDAFLVLDRNGNGQIDSSKELFGSTTEQPPTDQRNGFNALSAFDANHDGRIDQGDPIFSSLRLWLDRNHNGVSESTELLPLRAIGLLSLSLDYREIPRTDRHGNLFRFVAPVKLKVGREVVTRRAYDVFFFAR
jgi:hypothetical protein